MFLAVVGEDRARRWVTMLASRVQFYVQRHQPLPSLSARSPWTCLDVWPTATFAVVSERISGTDEMESRVYKPLWWDGRQPVSTKYLTEIASLRPVILSMTLADGTYIIASMNGKHPIGRHFVEDLSLLPKRVMVLPASGPGLHIGGSSTSKACPCSNLPPSLARFLTSHLCRTVRNPRLRQRKVQD